MTSKKDVLNYKCRSLSNRRTNKTVGSNVWFSGTIYERGLSTEELSMREDYLRGDCMREDERTIYGETIYERGLSTRRLYERGREDYLRGDYL